MQKESKILQGCLLALSRRGAYAERRNVGIFQTFDGRTVSIGVVGAADINAIYRGRSVNVETKSKRGVISADQRKWKAAVEKAGGLYFVVRSVDELEEQLDLI